MAVLKWLHKLERSKVQEGRSARATRHRCAQTLPGHGDAAKVSPRGLRYDIIRSGRLLLHRWLCCWSKTTRAHIITLLVSMQLVRMLLLRRPVCALALLFSLGVCLCLSVHFFLTTPSEGDAPKGEGTERSKLGREIPLTLAR